MKPTKKKETTKKTTKKDDRLTDLEGIVIGLGGRVKELENILERVRKRMGL